MWKGNRFGTLVSLIVMAIVVGRAAAQTDGTTISLLARGDADLAAQTAIEIRAVEDRPEYRDLAPAIEEFLQARNLQPAERGQLILRYEFQIDGAVNPRDPSFSLQGRTGIGGSTDMQMTLRLRQESQSRHSRRVVMNFELYQPGSPPIWTARLEGPDIRGDRRWLLEEMTRIAITNLGKTNIIEVKIDN